MSEEEFKVHMGYVDGKSDADLLIEAEQDEMQESMEKLHVLKVSILKVEHTSECILPCSHVAKA